MLQDVVRQQPTMRARLLLLSDLRQVLQRHSDETMWDVEAKVKAVKKRKRKSSRSNREATVGDLVVEVEDDRPGEDPSQEKGLPAAATNDASVAGVGEDFHRHPMRDRVASNDSLPASLTIESLSPRSVVHRDSDPVGGSVCQRSPLHLTIGSEGGNEMIPHVDSQPASTRASIVSPLHANTDAALSEVRRVTPSVPHRPRGSSRGSNGRHAHAAQEPPVASVKVPKAPDTTEVDHPALSVNIYVDETAEVDGSGSLLSPRNLAANEQVMTSGKGASTLLPMPGDKGRGEALSKQLLVSSPSSRRRIVAEPMADAGFSCDPPLRDTAQAPQEPTSHESDVTSPFREQHGVDGGNSADSGSAPSAGDGDDADDPSDTDVQISDDEELDRRNAAWMERSRLKSMPFIFGGVGDGKPSASDGDPVMGFEGQTQAAFHGDASEEQLGVRWFADEDEQLFIDFIDCVLHNDQSWMDHFLDDDDEELAELKAGRRDLDYDLLVGSPTAAAMTAQLPRGGKSGGPGDGLGSRRGSDSQMGGGGGLGSRRGSTRRRSSSSIGASADLLGGNGALKRRRDVKLLDTKATNQLIETLLTTTNPSAVIESAQAPCPHCKLLPTHSVPLVFHNAMRKFWSDRKRAEPRGSVHVDALARSGSIDAAAADIPIAYTGVASRTDVEAMLPPEVPLSQLTALDNEMWRAVASEVLRDHVSPPEAKRAALINRFDAHMSQPAWRKVQEELSKRLMQARLQGQSNVLKAKKKLATVQSEIASCQIEYQQLQMRIGAFGDQFVGERLMSLIELQQSTAAREVELRDAQDELETAKEEADFLRDDLDEGMTCLAALDKGLSDLRSAFNVVSAQVRIASAERAENVLGANAPIDDPQLAALRALPPAEAFGSQCRDCGHLVGSTKFCGATGKEHPQQLFHAHIAPVAKDSRSAVLRRRTTMHAASQKVAPSSGAQSVSRSSSILGTFSGHDDTRPTAAASNEMNTASPPWKVKLDQVRELPSQTAAKREEAAARRKHALNGGNSGGGAAAENLFFESDDEAADTREVDPVNNATSTAPAATQPRARVTTFALSDFGVDASDSSTTETTSNEEDNSAEAQQRRRRRRLQARRQRRADAEAAPSDGSRRPHQRRSRGGSGDGGDAAGNDAAGHNEGAEHRARGGTSSAALTELKQQRDVEVAALVQQLVLLETRCLRSMMLMDAADASDALRELSRCMSDFASVHKFATMFITQQSVGKTPNDGKGDEGTGGRRRPQLEVKAAEPSSGDLAAQLSLDAELEMLSSPALNTPGPESLLPPIPQRGSSRFLSPPAASAVTSSPEAAAFLPVPPSGGAPHKTAPRPGAQTSSTQPASGVAPTPTNLEENGEFGVRMLSDIQEALLGLSGFGAQSGVAATNRSGRFGNAATSAANAAGRAGSSAAPAGEGPPRRSGPGPSTENRKFLELVAQQAALKTEINQLNEVLRYVHIPVKDLLLQASELEAEADDLVDKLRREQHDRQTEQAELEYMASAQQLQLDNAAALFGVQRVVHDAIDAMQSGS